MTKELENEVIEKMVGKERKRLLNFIRRKVSSDTETEDILQEVFYMFLKTIQFKPIEKVSSWMYHVAENKIIDWYRKYKTVSLQKLDVQNSNNATESSLRLEDILFDPLDNPADLYIRSTVWTLLADALDELPIEQKEVFIMNELEDKSFKEISELTGVTVNTLISRKRYAILFLRERLKDLYDEFIYN